MIADLLATAGFTVAATGWAVTACRAARLRHLLRTDPLTGLANRDALAARLRRHTRREAAVGLLLADLDGFKQVNDVHGHDVGNVLLRGISRRMRAVAHPGELVVRLHGDEFAILLGNLPSGAAGARSAAQRRNVFAAAVDTPMRVAASEVRVSASIGTAVLPAANADLSSLLSAADQDMYHAKRSRGARRLADGRGGLRREARYGLSYLVAARAAAYEGPETNGRERGISTRQPRTTPRRDSCRW